MDFKIIPQKKRPANKYDDETFVIPAKLLLLGKQNLHPRVFQSYLNELTLKVVKSN